MPIRQGLNKKSKENAKFSVIKQTNIPGAWICSKALIGDCEQIKD